MGLFALAQRQDSSGDSPIGFGSPLGALRLAHQSADPLLGHGLARPPQSRYTQAERFRHLLLLSQTSLNELHCGEFVIDFVRTPIGVEGKQAVEDRPNLAVVTIPDSIIDRPGSFRQSPFRVQSSLTSVFLIHLKVTPRRQ